MLYLSASRTQIPFAGFEVRHHYSFSLGHGSKSGLTLISDWREGKEILVFRKQLLQVRPGGRQSRLTGVQPHPDPYLLLHTLGCHVDTIQVGVASLPRVLAESTRTPSPHPAAEAAALRGGVSVPSRRLPSPQRRAGGGTQEGKPWVFEAATPETPREGGAGRRSVSPELCNRPSRGGHSRAARGADPRRVLTKSERSCVPGVEPAGRSLRASKSAGPPLCDFTRFATSPDHSRPTHPGPLLRRPPPPPIFLSLQAGPASAVAESPVPTAVAVCAVVAAWRAGTWRPPPLRAARRLAPELSAVHF